MFFFLMFVYFNLSSFFSFFYGNLLKQTCRISCWEQTSFGILHSHRNRTKVPEGSGCLDRKEFSKVEFRKDVEFNDVVLLT